MSWSISGTHGCTLIPRQQVTALCTAEARHFPMCMQQGRRPVPLDSPLSFPDPRLFFFFKLFRKIPSGYPRTSVSRATHTPETFLLAIIGTDTNPWIQSYILHFIISKPFYFQNLTHLNDNLVRKYKTCILQEKKWRLLRSSKDLSERKME